MVVGPEDLRKGMRQWATGVCVVSSVFEGVRHGMTVNSFTSISLTPPLVSVSLERITRTCNLVHQSGVFGVTILQEGQQEISEYFAGRPIEREDRFANLGTFTLVTGASLIEGGLAYFDCRVVEKLDAGTHTLFIAEVVATELAEKNGPEEQPLIYFNRSYRGLQK